MTGGTIKISRGSKIFDGQTKVSILPDSQIKTLNGRVAKIQVDIDKLKKKIESIEKLLFLTLRIGNH